MMEFDYMTDKKCGDTSFFTVPLNEISCQLTHLLAVKGCSWCPGIYTYLFQSCVTHITTFFYMIQSQLCLNPNLKSSGASLPNTKSILQWWRVMHRHVSLPKTKSVLSDGEWCTDMSSCQIPNLYFSDGEWCTDMSPCQVQNLYFSDVQLLLTPLPDTLIILWSFQRFRYNMGR